MSCSERELLFSDNFDTVLEIIETYMLQKDKEIELEIKCPASVPLNRRNPAAIFKDSLSKHFTKLKVLELKNIYVKIQRIWPKKNFVTQQSQNSEFQWWKLFQMISYSSQMWNHLLVILKIFHPNNYKACSDIKNHKNHVFRIQSNIYDDVFLRKYDF